MSPARVEIQTKEGKLWYAYEIKSGQRTTVVNHLGRQFDIVNARGGVSGSTDGVEYMRRSGVESKPDVIQLSEKGGKIVIYPISEFKPPKNRYEPIMRPVTEEFIESWLSKGYTAVRCFNCRKVLKVMVRRKGRYYWLLNPWAFGSCEGGYGRPAGGYHSGQAENLHKGEVFTPSGCVINGEWI